MQAKAWYMSRLLAIVLAWTLSAVSAAAQTSPEIIEYYAIDGIGSTRVVFAPDGTVRGRGDYSPFGEELTGIGLPTERFAGQPRDAEAGLDYFNARSYEPRTGRFTRVDPLFANAPRNPQLWNRYSYALNNPLSFTDPSGLLPNDNCSWDGNTNTINCIVPPPSDPRRGGNDGGRDCGSVGCGDSKPGRPGPNPNPNPPTPTPPTEDPGPTEDPNPPGPPLCEIVHNCDPPTGDPKHDVEKNDPQAAKANVFTAWTPITYVGISGAFITFFGVQGSVGLYWTGCCMPVGWYHNEGVGAGLNVGIGPVVGRYYDGPATFSGASGNISASLGPVGGSIYFPMNKNQYWSGWDVGLSYGLPVGLSAGVSNTTMKPF